MHGIFDWPRGPGFAYGINNDRAQNQESRNLNHGHKQNQQGPEACGRYVRCKEPHPCEDRLDDSDTQHIPGQHFARSPREIRRFRSPFAREPRGHCPGKLMTAAGMGKQSAGDDDRNHELQNPGSDANRRWRGWTATAMIMPQAIGSMNGRPILKHQTWSRPRTAIRIVASIALLSNNWSFEESPGAFMLRPSNLRWRISSCPPEAGHQPPHSDYSSSKTETSIQTQDH